MSREVAAGTAVGALIVALAFTLGPGVAEGPRFTADDRLALPEDFRRWVFAGSSLGLGYREPGAEPGLGMFHTVLIHPTAYDGFVRTGEFPEGTMLALVMYQRAEKVPPSRSGYFEGDFVALEIALKDTRRFDEGWGYFDFTASSGTLRDSAPRIDPAAGCNACHARHGAVDNVFVQFYPNLRRGRM